MPALVVSDLDGTLLNDEGRISGKDFSTLLRFRKKGIIGAIATGRNLNSCRQLLPDDFPIEYLIFSNGCGIMHWPSKAIISAHSLSSETVPLVFDVLKGSNFDFFVHSVIPQNHMYRFHQYDRANADFNLRMNRSLNFVLGEMNEHTLNEGYSQFLAIISPNTPMPEFDEQVHRQCSVIKATSPLNGTSKWLEIYPENVSKGYALKTVCRLTDCHLEQTYALGNDFNDISMLEIAAYGHLVKNATAELIGMFNPIVSNNENPLSALAKNHKLL